MYFVVAIEVFLSILLYFLAVKSGSLQKEKKYSFFSCIAQYIYTQCVKHSFKMFRSMQVKQDLQHLYPEKEQKEITANYYVQKIEVLLVTIFLGSLFCMAISIKAQSNRRIDEEGKIQKLSYQEDTKQMKVAAQIEKQKRQVFEVDIGVQSLDTEQLQVLYEQFVVQLPKLILGKNNSLDEVTQDLALLEQYEEYPFFIVWESKQPLLLSDTGSVCTVEKEREVTLLATISYENWSWTQELKVVLIPPVLSQEETLHQALQELIVQAQTESQKETQWKLPEEWQEQQIIWQEVVEDDSYFFLAGVFVLSALLYICKDKDLHQCAEKKKKEMKEEYPEIVSKMTLYLGAGMTIRSAFGKIAQDYEQRLRSGETKKAIYEEIHYTYRQLQAGISEISAYEAFGRRTGLQEYIRMTTLFIQNLKKGNHRMLSYLEEEAAKSMEQKLQDSKKLGEEASTKLLIPMVMMLAVVMVMVMIPAFSTMQ